MKDTIYYYRGTPVYNGMELMLTSGHPVKLNTEQYKKEDGSGTRFFYLCGDGPNLNGGHHVEKFGYKYAWAFAPGIDSTNSITYMPRVDHASIKRAPQPELHYEIF